MGGEIERETERERQRERERERQTDRARETERERQSEREREKRREREKGTFEARRQKRKQSHASEVMFGYATCEKRRYMRERERE